MSNYKYLSLEFKYHFNQWQCPGCIPACDSKNMWPWNPQKCCSVKHVMKPGVCSCGQQFNILATLTICFSVVCQPQYFLHRTSCWSSDLVLLRARSYLMGRLLERLLWKVTLFTAAWLNPFLHNIRNLSADITSSYHQWIFTSSMVHSYAAM